MKQLKPFLRNALVVLVVLLTPIWLPLIVLGFVLILLYHAALYILIWMIWLPSGKDVLFVYSDSPIWKEYMIEQILPLVQERAVVLNWSERAKWRRSSLAVAVFLALGGDYEFNPLVMVFRPFHLARRFRFWSAFRAWKRGDKEPVTKLRQELTLIL